jgi:hypothetical protein
MILIAAGLNAHQPQIYFVQFFQWFYKQASKTPYKRCLSLGKKNGNAVVYVFART